LGELRWAPIFGAIPAGAGDQGYSAERRQFGLLRETWIAEAGQSIFIIRFCPRSSARRRIGGQKNVVRVDHRHGIESSALVLSRAALWHCKDRIIR